MRTNARPAVVQALAQGTLEAIAAWLESVPESDERLHQLTGLSHANVQRLGGLLDVTTGTVLIRGVNVALGARFLEHAPQDVTLGVLDSVGADRASLVLRAMSDARRDTLLATLPESVAEPVRQLLRWPLSTAAGHMIPEAFTTSIDSTAGATMAGLRAASARLRSDSQVGANVYVVDARRVLVGVAGFRDVAMAPPHTPITALMSTPTTVSPEESAETAAELLLSRGLAAVPVVDGNGTVLGVLTDAVADEVALTHAAAIAARQGGSEPLEVPYLQASPWLLWRKRIVWLLVLFAAEAYTGTVLRAFSEEMEAVVALAFFIPLLIGTGGNTGTQITSTLVRALGTGEVRMRDVPRILRKELSTGILIAMSMAAVAVVRAWFLGVGPEVTVTVAVTIAAIVLWSSIVSSVLPPLLHKLRIDPAVVSAPLISTVVDGTGLMIYFMTAHLMLSQLNGL